ncbi:response regulator transcription factor [Chryseobacterium sp. SNU WT5]|uniref:response regulator transcription factor n=1 Tax=Chryseobacterium sp. SNU WT5 TaxID=2594269 RepID=UPI00117E5C37|nr:response regulator transcription factor [Chryseobacterium sp. SNU WT5]QDP84982.1 response regulator transcription factor [Chryseobacterium sp. SNU WT5]
MKILIVEDEVQMLENMTKNLLAEGYLVETASNFVQAQERIGVYEYDCILLDINLPDGNGLELLKIIKEKGLQDGVIIVSARDSLDDKLQGLDLGADDYLPKPFHMAELRARVKAVLRRKKFEGHDEMKIGNISINTSNRTLFIENKEVELNRKEYDVLLYLASNKDRLVNKNALAEHVWGDNIDQADSFDFIYSQIKNLRKKLDSNSADIEIKAVYGIGYKMQNK